MSLRSLRPSTPFLALLAIALVLFVALLLVPGAPVAGSGRALVERLGLTDLALFTEARYTRHLSLADYHAPFQDHPGALEHFPSGAIAPPPPVLTHAPLAE